MRIARNASFEPRVTDAALSHNVCYGTSEGFEVLKHMFGFGRRSKVLPILEGGLKWWVIESERYNHASKAPFRVFEAVVARSEEMAIENSRISDEKLDKTLMDAAIRTGEIDDEFDWEPVSTLVRHLSVSSVATQKEIAELDKRFWVCCENMNSF